MWTAAADVGEAVPRPADGPAAGSSVRVLLPGEGGIAVLTASSLCASKMRSGFADAC